jgi:hypothetical protein
MTVRGVVAGTLSTCSLGGLALVAFGVVPWGVRAVALFTLLGFVWLFLLIALVGADAYAHRAPLE